MLGIAHIVSVCPKKKISLFEGQEIEEVAIEEPDFCEHPIVPVYEEHLLFIYCIKHAPIEPIIEDMYYLLFSYPS